MDRQALVRQESIRELEAVKAQVASLLKRKEKYIDPDYAIDPASGRNLWERYNDVCMRIGRERPEFVSSIPVVKAHRDDLEEPLNREQLKSLDHSIDVLLQRLDEIPVGW